MYSTPIKYLGKFIELSRDVVSARSWVLWSFVEDWATCYLAEAGFGDESRRHVTQLQLPARTQDVLLIPD